VKRIDFWFDCISPYAWLAFDALPQALEGLSYTVDHRPLLLGGVLQHWGQKGPAEIAPKRDWTYRQVQWLAQRQGLRLQLPRQHPFNPLALQRLAVACTPAGAAGPSRRVVQALFEHVWAAEGADANDPARLESLAATLAPARDPQSDAVKQALRASTEVALAQGVFGVPAFGCDGRLFWGLDALPMLRAALSADPWFDGPAWADAAAARPAVQRGAKT
jgi:2-hydroxychromene-2-carboxylate isomerase